VSSRAGGQLDGRARWGDGYKRRRDDQASAGPVAPVPARGYTLCASDVGVHLPSLQPQGDPQPASVTQDTPAPPIRGAAAAGPATPSDPVPEKVEYVAVAGVSESGWNE
jgi:hypothetical protein